MRLMTAAALLVCIVGQSLSVAAAEQPFSQAAYERALKAGNPVVVEFAADWCSTCRAQKPLVKAILAEPKMQRITLFVADFDKETSLRRSLGVIQQSTFVVFKAGHEVDRSTGQTDHDDIEALFNEALQ